MEAELLIRERVVFADGSLVEMVIWRVPEPVPPSTHRFKYRLVYVVDGRRVLGYDNERIKGDHRHFLDAEEPFEFTSIDEVMARFVAEVNALRTDK